MPKTTQVLPRRRLAFTLIELLVVIAIIAILAGMLLPALSKAKERAKAANCLSDFRQWGISVQLYGGEYNDGIPRDGMNAGGTYNPGDSFQANAWFNLLPKFVGEQPLTNYTLLAVASAQQNSTILPFPGGKGKIFSCPSARMSSADFTALAQQGRDGFFSFVMNVDLKRQTPGYANADAYPYAGTPNMPKLTAIPKPSRTVFLFDCAFSPTTEIVNGSPQFNSVNPANRWRNAASRHREGANISFLDGHAAFSKLSVITNNGTVETPGSLLIWNPPYRQINP